MKTKAKVILVALVIGIISIGTTVSFITKNEKFKSSSNETHDKKDVKPNHKKENDNTIDEETNNEEIDNTDILDDNSSNIIASDNSANNNNNDDNKTFILKKSNVSETNKTNSSSSSKEEDISNSNDDTNKPSINHPIINEPSNPQLPTEDIEVTELVINNSMLANNQLIIDGKTFKTVHIASDIPNNAHIVFNNVKINDGLSIELSNNYQLDLIDTDLTSIETVSLRPMLFSFFSLKNTLSSNKTIDGPTINMIGCSNIESIGISGNMEINGDNLVGTVYISDGKDVIVNVMTDELLIQEEVSNLTVSVNEEVSLVSNYGNNLDLIVNSNVGEINNLYDNINIKINNNKTIDTLVNNGNNIIVSGNGMIDTLKINGEGTRVYTAVNEDNIVIKEDVKTVLVRNEKNTSITSVKSKTQGNVTFTLSEPVWLTKNDISVICTAGKNIEIFGELYTTDNQTYSLSTSYFKNNSYGLYITLPNGNIISKNFATEYDKPSASNEVTTRLSDMEATLELYGIDEGGVVYYVLNNEMLTPEQIKSEAIKNGTKANVKTGYNKITIPNLEANKSYNLSYVIEGFYNNISSVNGPLTIDANVVEVEDTEYKIIYAKEEIINRFAFKLNKAVEGGLTLDDFTIICPSLKPLTLTGATLTTSPDGLMYIITIPDNYGHLDNNYTVKININGTTISKDFEVSFNPPSITGEKVGRVDENTASLSFYSDKPGTVYYGVYTWNGGIYDYNSTTPMAVDVITGAIPSTKTVLNSHTTQTINIDLTNIEVTKYTRIWALFVDNDGNYRTGFVNHYGNIPEYVKEPEIEEPESTLKINSISAGEDYIYVTFNEDVGYISNEDFKLSVLEGSPLQKILFSTSYDSQNKTAYLDIQNEVYLYGKYMITFTLTDSKGKEVILKKEFTVK